VLSRTVSELRRALGDDSKAPRYIQTIPKGGYRLIASVTSHEPAAVALPEFSRSGQPSSSSNIRGTDPGTRHSERLPSTRSSRDTVHGMSISRREMLSGLIATGAGLALPGRSGAATGSDLRVDAARLQRNLEALSVFGRPAGGTFADGVSRTAYSDADIAGRKFAMDLMREAGLEPRVDTAANIFAARAGSDPALTPILFGSHIDSVPGGGNFDGDLGSFSAIEAVRTLQEHGVVTRHPLQVVIWSNEEGGTIGSRAAIGDLNADDLARSYNGYTRADGIRRLGGDPTRLGDARLAPGAFRCYIELHIEQGGSLYKSGIPVGVVEGIVSIDEYEVEIRGFANHAGTTPMPERKNALLAAAKLIEVVQDVVAAEPGRQVGTVGRLEVFPGARNVVPGLVKHSLELRDLSPEKIARLGKEVQQRAEAIARETGTTIVITPIEHDPPAIATPEVQAAIETAAAGLGLKTSRLPSGAGHDAQNVARIVPMGMIFVPSVDGISHSPRELTHWDDCANGANMLLQTVLQMDLS
jgi:beta-ureidopropionase / N-carbamoyl-L-amino-acid hydrolase